MKQKVKEKIIKLREAGRTIADIASQVGLTYDQTYHVLRPSASQKKRVDPAKLTEAILAGHDTATITSTFNITTGTLSVLKSQLGLTNRIKKEWSKEEIATLLENHKAGRPAHTGLTGRTNNAARNKLHSLLNA